MVMEIKSLVEVQTNTTKDTTKYINQFLNYSNSHTDAITEYRRNGMILHIYLDASYISEPEERRTAGGYFS